MFIRRVIYQNLSSFITSCLCSRLDHSFRQQLRALPVIILRSLNNSNLFPASPPSNDPNQLRTQRISTRVFIFFFILSLYVLLIYTSTITRITTIVVQNPDLQQYNDLLSQHLQALTCPCNQISTRFDSFTHINYTHHHICTSFYTTDLWITHMSPSLNSTDALDTTDFRLMGSNLFQGLRSFCQLAEEFIQTSLLQFSSNHYISALATSKSILEVQVEAIIDQFILSTTNNFLLSLRTIGNTTQANALLSVLMTNYVLSVVTESLQVYTAWFNHDNNCTCRDTSTCISNLSIHDSVQSLSGWAVPGFYCGCFVIEALRQSRLECLYDQICLDELQSRLPSAIPFDFVAFDPSLSKRFEPTTAIGVIIDALMVEEWYWTIEHDKYYDVCKPADCSYTVITRNNVITIVTTMVGLIGGLTTALRIVVPRLVLLTFKCIRRLRQNVHPRSDISMVAAPDSSRQATWEDFNHWWATFRWTICFLFLLPRASFLYELLLSRYSAPRLNYVASFQATIQDWVSMRWYHQFPWCGCVIGDVDFCPIFWTSHPLKLRRKFGSYLT